jgi:hypothetical protein
VRGLISSGISCLEKLRRCRHGLLWEMSISCGKGEKTVRGASENFQ